MRTSQSFTAFTLRSTPSLNAFFCLGSLSAPTGGSQLTNTSCTCGSHTLSSWCAGLFRSSWSTPWPLASTQMERKCLTACSLVSPRELMPLSITSVRGETIKIIPSKTSKESNPILKEVKWKKENRVLPGECSFFRIKIKTFRIRSDNWSIKTNHISNAKWSLPKNFQICNLNFRQRLKSKIRRSKLLWL